MPTIHHPVLPGRDYLVPVPRTTDAIGAALRGAYGRSASTPTAFREMLAALDENGND